MIFILLPIVVFLHLYFAPYTKVEESFNLQATHDILTYGLPPSLRNGSDFLASRFDHVLFPGAVPRTFVGAATLAGLSQPVTGFARTLLEKQMVVRGVLGFINVVCLLALNDAVRKTFGRTAGTWFILFQTSQFHVMFYASRTLPNMFAFAFTTIALRSLMLSYAFPGPTSSPRYHRLVLFLLTLSSIIFRAEIVVLLVTTTLTILYSSRTSYWNTITKQVIPAGLAGAVIGLALTVPIDSFFWQRLIWPEAHAFLFNTVEGHASDWGVSPWHFYFSSALPRLMLNPLTFGVCVPLAVFQPGLRKSSSGVLIPLLGFVALYSILPHKEARFIIYVVPGLTAVAAAGAQWIWLRRGKNLLYRLASLGLIASVAACYAASAAMLALSSANYPGGEAMTRLHDIVSKGPSSSMDSGLVRVHLDDLTCQTGATRFLQMPLNSGWAYDKTENQTLLHDPSFWQRFDYVLAESQERVIGKWEVVDVVKAFEGIKLLRPGESRHSADAVEEGLEHMASRRQGLWYRGLELWGRVEDLVRPTLPKKYWVDIRMVPRIKILRRQSLEYDGVHINTDSAATS